MGLLFLFTASFMFIALGFLLHWFSQKGRRIFLYILYVFTFLFDAFLAYEIVHKIHSASSIVNEVEPWRISMAFSDMKFYIILFAGLALS